MSIDLVVSSKIDGTPVQVQDQDGGKSSLYLSTASTSITSSSSLVFGIDDGTGGFGEYITNTSNGTARNFGLSFFGDGKERMTIAAASGNVGIGITTPSSTLHVQGNVRFSSLGSGSGTDLVADANGNVALQSSSARFKEKIREFKDDFKKILSLKPVSFQYKDSDLESVGYLAEELQEKGLQSLVSHDEAGAPFSVHYKLMPVYLLEILKEQQNVIEKLQAEVKALKTSFTASNEQMVETN